MYNTFFCNFIFLQLLGLLQQENKNTDFVGQNFKNPDRPDRKGKLKNPFLLQRNLENAI